MASYIGAGIQDIMSGLLIEGNKHLVNGVETYNFTCLLYTSQSIYEITIYLMGYYGRRT